MTQPQYICRRSFVRVALSAAIGVAMMPLSGALHASIKPGSEVNVPLPKYVWVRDLSGTPISLTLKPGVASEPVSVPGNGSYRIKVTPLGIDSRVDKMSYEIAVLDGDSAQKLEVMLVTDNTEATFGRFHLQVWVGETPTRVK